MNEVLCPSAGLKARKHKHAVHFYDTDCLLIAELTRFIGAAIGGGDSAIVIATKSHRESLEERLRRQGFETANPGFRKRYLAFDAAECLSKFMVDGLPDSRSFSQIMINVLTTARVASENPRPQVVAFGEMVALLWADGRTVAAIELERLWNELAHTNSFNLLCAYPNSLFSDIERVDQLSAICAEHSDVTSRSVTPPYNSADL